tara:strand:- start:840 stop:1058 length:219 start_codon:yes stop_codon:yes gene_type:complete
MLICNNYEILKAEAINYRYQCPLIIGKLVLNQGNNYLKLLPIIFGKVLSSIIVLIKSTILPKTTENYGGINA